MTAPQEPGTWPALLHRLVSSWSALLRLLFGLAALVAIITVALCFLGDVAVQIGPFGVERRLEPTLSRPALGVTRGRVCGMESLQAVSSWPVGTAATAVVGVDGEVLGTYGPLDHRFPLASVTKLLTSYAVLVAVEEGAVEWDQPAGPATVRHLIAHTSGLAFDSNDVQAAPGTRRIYSNTGFEVLADFVEAATEIPFATYLHEAVFAPLGMTSSTLDGSAAAGATSTATDLVRFAAEVQAPKLVSAELVAEATSVAFPGLRGVLPGFGLQKHNDWGLGFEIRSAKSPHWTGSGSSARTFGHFGQSGTFLWVDPEAGVACVALTDRKFGEWAVGTWPRFTDDVLAELGRANRSTSARTSPSATA